MKINFNVKSVKAWAALASAVIGACVSILTALGIVVKQTDATTLYGAITAVISLLTAFGVVTAATDKQPTDPKH